jgi:hypothetical protein
MTEIIERTVISGGPGELAQVIREVGGNVSRIQVGEGKDAVIIDEANPANLRKCAGCTFCCTVAGINELHKPAFTPCRHLKGKGCGIYQDRPGSCSEFACGWLLGNFDERFRPDKIGAYVAFFSTEEFGFYAVVQVDSRLAHRKRLRQLLRRLDVLPEIRIIYDDKRGLIIRPGQPPIRFKTLPRAPGDYETLVYRLEAPQ